MVTAIQFYIYAVEPVDLMNSDGTYPGVTVLIPCNSTKFLAECLDSIAGQDYPNLDVLVILNGDASLESNDLTQRFADYSRIVRFALSGKKGIVSALNLGLELSNNEFVARIDADDLMPPGRITLQVTRFSQDFELVCIGGQLEFLANSSTQKHPGYPLTDRAFRHALYRFSPLPHPGIMYKKSAVKRAGMYRETYPYVEDWDLWIRLAEQGKILNIPETTVYYRIHSNQSTALHSTVQQKSVKALSSEMLKRTLNGPQQLNAHGSHYSEPDSVAKFFRIAFSRKKPFVAEGLFGQKAKRRALAGYFYIHLMDRNSSKIQIISVRILITLIDPALLLRKFD